MKKKHGKIVRLAIIGIDEVLPHVVARGNNGQKRRKLFAGYEINIVSRKLATFAYKGIICNFCGLRGEYFAIEQILHQQDLIPHLNLYGIDKDGDEVLLTSDHIIPLNKGGKNCMDNRQTLCKICNESKGDRIL